MFISADEPETTRQRFRKELGLDLRLRLVADEEHVTAEHYGIGVSYRSPRKQVYPNGFNQPAIFAFCGEREVFRFVQQPGVLNLGGAAFRPTVKRVLRAFELERTWTVSYI